MGRMPSAVGYQPTLGDRDGRARRAHHLDAQGLDHLGASRLRSGRRLHRSRRRDDVRPSRRDDRALAPDLGARHLSGRRSAGLDRRASSIRRSSATSTTRSRAACKRRCSATKTCRTSSRFSASKSSPKTTRSPSAARAASSASSRSRSSSPNSSRAARASTSSSQDTIASFKEILDGKLDHLPEQAFFYRRRDRRSQSQRREDGREGLSVASTVPFRLITPTAVAFEGEAELVIAVTTEGEDGILPQHAPFLTALSRACCARTSSGERWRTTRLELATGEGFMQALPDRVTVLVDEAVRFDDVVVAKPPARSCRGHASARRAPATEQARLRARASHHRFRQREAAPHRPLKQETD